MSYTPFQTRDAWESEAYAFAPDRYRLWLSEGSPAKVIGSPLTGDNQRAGVASPAHGSVLVVGGDE